MEVKMDRLKVVKFLEAKRDFLFPNKKYSDSEIENALIAAPDLFEMSMTAIPFRKPKTVKTLSVLLGLLGIDRFYLGDIGLGILKYGTWAAFTYTMAIPGIYKYIILAGTIIWWIADIISAKKRCRAYNCKKLMNAINDPSVIEKMQAADNKLKNAANTAKRFAPVAKELYKGAKEVGKGFYVDD